jgi:diaminopimelate decarboxylase
MTTQTPNMRVEPWTYQVKDGQPWVGGMPLLALAQQHGTPLYVLDGAGISTMAQAYQKAIKAHYAGEALVLYACKANMTTGLAHRMHQLGMGLDVVSGGEVYTAHKAGVPMDKLFFNGNNKSVDELTLALTLGVGHITVDNLTELDLLAQTAQQLGTRAKILMRITPGIDCHTHDYIRTGQVDSKFGFNLSDLDAALTAITGPYCQAIELCGLHAHIGSQIFERQPYLDLVDVLLTHYQHVRHTYGLTLPLLNIGGGLGIAYTPQDDPLNVSDVLTAVCQHLTQACQQTDYPLPRLLLEPGRSMVATSGITLYRIGSQKVVPGATTYLAVDGGMGDNIRPSLYGARYTALVANRLTEPADTRVTIAGKYCESGDVLIRDLKIPASTTRDDVLLVFGTGAYNYSMASTYNRVPRPAMVWVEDGQATTLVRRETYDDLLALDV